MVGISDSVRVAGKGLVSGRVLVRVGISINARVSERIRAPVRVYRHPQSCLYTPNSGSSEGLACRITCSVAVLPSPPSTLERTWPAARACSKGVAGSLGSPSS